MNALVEASRTARNPCYHIHNIDAPRNAYVEVAECGRLLQKAKITEMTRYRVHRICHRCAAAFTKKHGKRTPAWVRRAGGKP